MQILAFPALVLTSLAAMAAAAAATTPPHNVSARLIADTGSIVPGKAFDVALEFNIRSGWHTYWRNPGDSGEATALQWDLPGGLVAGPIVWTAPHRFEIPPLVNFGYDRHAMHLVHIIVGNDVKVGSRLTLKAKADWLVCAEVCIPESDLLSLELPVTTASIAAASDIAGLFTAARAQIPQPLAASRARLDGGRLVLDFDAAWNPVLANPKSVYFFPYDEGIIDYPSPQELTRAGDGYRLAMKIGYAAPKTGLIKGVIVSTPAGGTAGADAAKAWEVAATSFTGARGAADTAGLPSLILFAILGGLILNLMPCVFPVLSIKAVGLVEQARHEPAKVKLKGLVFAAGVVASMLALAATLLVLRAGGQQIGWGFQLQSPLFVTFMAYLLLAVGLNLSGVFEFGGGLAGAGDRLTQGDGLRASFFTGVLTTLVATPCSAPYMAAAVGAALTQSPAFAVTIFVALGVGLALPYVLLCFAPGVRKRLPRPGAWMDTLKQLFAFPMYASAAWMLWVLAQQTSPVALAGALAGCVLLALAAWAFHQSQHGSGVGRRVAMTTAGVSIVLAIVLPWNLASDASTGGMVRGAANGDDWQPYDPAKVDALNAAGTPLLVNFTASWCLTCLVNERTAFSDSAVKDVFRRKGVVLMKGDWTRRDPVITAALTQFGRAGVPLYLAYNATPGQHGAVILPQLLSTSLIRETFAHLPDR